MLLAADEGALTEAYDLHAPSAFALALRVTGDRAGAEDAVQEAFLELWRKPERFDPHTGSLRTWLCTIARRRAIDWLRRQSAQRSYLTRLAGQAPITSSSTVPSIGAWPASRVR